MQTAARDLNNYQWRVVSNAISKCSLPIFVKLVFAEICRWKSYSKPQDTYLASNVMDSIMMLFSKVEVKHGRLLVSHALAYITASKNGLSESELEDLISLDDKCVPSLHPPLLHRQFNEAARKRYFTNQNQAMYFYSMIADYFLGMWGGGNPKPFKYTEIQRTQFGELPFHLVRARRFEDLYTHVLFNYQWLHAKLSSCPLQAVLSDFEDASAHIDDRDQIRELMLVADALRLGGAILSQYPDMLAPQLIGRLLPEMEANPHVKSLLEQCDAEGIEHCGLLPSYHCCHTPGGPLKTVLLNMLTSEFFLLENPMSEESVIGTLLSDTCAIIYSQRAWVVYTLRGEERERVTSPVDNPSSLWTSRVPRTSAWCVGLGTLTTRPPPVHGAGRTNLPLSRVPQVWETESGQAWRLKLPHGIRNISTQLLKSNSCVLSKGYKYAVAGVRKNLYVWELESQELLKVLDAHFGRIIDMVALVVGSWNSVITSSLDRTVKVWNINNIFEQVHVIDRHELQVDDISLAPHHPLAVTVTRNCVGIWNLRLGKLVSKLADSPLGAIVTHAAITNNARYIVSTESGNVLIWNVHAEAVVYKTEQKSVQQLMLLDEDTKVVTVSKVSQESGELWCCLVTRSVPSGAPVYQLDYPIRSFRQVAVTADGLFLVIPSVDGIKDALIIYHAKTGTLVHKMPLKYPAYKDFHLVVPLPNKPTQVALIDPDKGNLVDIRTKKFVRSIPKWGGKVSRDGRYGLYAPARGGLELVELRHGTLVRTLIPRVAEGVFSVICLFTRTDEYVLYYHGGRKTIRVFRLSDGRMIANYRVQAELTAIAGSEDGRTIVLGTVDGCLSSLTIADPTRPGIRDYLTDLPSRNPKKYEEEVARQGRSLRQVVNMIMLTNRLKPSSSHHSSTSSPQQVSA
ncbi:hypothetical protein Pmani_036667 [Petrolisthes manimaculis]|uniref:Uncharacterized protein n=1 Tax=Petrolisthes manimaculis TaxID=1843537 RepID=A0AAE1NHY1_9EUCA|nr:hypothetical protein Pmani_036667 [Petrolisthes manimaculis]